MRSVKPIYLFLLAASIFSCRPAKQIQAVIAPKDTTKQVVVTISEEPKFDSAAAIKGYVSDLKSKYIDYNTFSAKIKVDYDNGKTKTPDINAFVRMKKDSIIWISINAILGIEAFRVVVTKDSVKVLDKQAKEVIFKPLSYLQEITEIPLDLNAFQELLIGNPVFFNEENVISFNNEGKNISLLSVGEIFKNLLTIGLEDKNLSHIKLADISVERNRTSDISYSDYDKTLEIPFSLSRRIIVSEKGRLDINLNYKQFAFNEPLTYPFSIPKNFKRKKG